MKKRHCRLVRHGLEHLPLPHTSEYNPRSVLHQVALYILSISFTYRPIVYTEDGKNEWKGLLPWRSMEKIMFSPVDRKAIFHAWYAQKTDCPFPFFLVLFSRVSEDFSILALEMAALATRRFVIPPLLINKMFRGNYFKVGFQTRRCYPRYPESLYRPLARSGQREP